LLSQQLKQQNKNAIYGALGSLGGAGITAAPALNAASDRNLKRKHKINW
jgi:hypothetical protein